MNQKPTIPEVADLFRRYHDLPGNGEWGSLHVVLADGNVEDSSVQFCIEWSHEKGDVFGGALARILLYMTKTQRRKLPSAATNPGRP